MHNSCNHYRFISKLTHYHNTSPDLFGHMLLVLAMRPIQIDV